jgi:tetratricopeptide (TPR) repeat protein
MLRACSSNIMQRKALLPLVKQRSSTWRRSLQSLTATIRVEDPSYAAAYARMADCWLLLPGFADADLAEVMPKARVAASRALQLDDSSAEAHDALGLVALLDFDWRSADRELRRAIELNASDYSAHHRYGLLLAIRGQLPDARREFEQALRHNPFSEESRVMLAWTLKEVGEPDRAIAEARKAIELYRSEGAEDIIVATYVKTKRYAAALGALDAKRKPTLDSLMWRACIHSLSGHRDEVVRTAAEFERMAGDGHVGPGKRAPIQMALGNRDRAFALIERAIDERDWIVAFLKSGTIWEPLRADPRFGKLLARLRLDD